MYASGKVDSFLERLKSGGDGRIILSSKDPSVMGGKVRVLAEGFLQLRQRVEKILSSGTAAKKYGGPASVLAELLDAQEVVDHLTLYARGDQRMIAELMPLRSRSSRGSSAPKGSDARRIALALGVWLYDSILRFPGVIVNRIAAASFLGIDVDDFAEERVRRVFQKALYEGPFADPDDPRWWKHRLLERIADGKVSDGRELAEKITRRKL